MSTNKNLYCSDCGLEFVFSAEEQCFFAERGLLHQPKRCSSCRIDIRNWRKSKQGESTTPAAVVVCARCSASVKVPFQPKGHKPIYCQACLHSNNGGDVDKTAD